MHQRLEQRVVLRALAPRGVDPERAVGATDALAGQPVESRSGLAEPGHERETQSCAHQAEDRVHVARRQEPRRRDLHQLQGLELVTVVRQTVRVGDEMISFSPYPAALMSLVSTGGLIPFLQEKGDYPR